MIYCDLYGDCELLRGYSHPAVKIMTVAIGDGCSEVVHR